MTLSLLLLVALALLAPMLRDDDTKILIEAESRLAIRPSFEKVVTKSRQASGGAYLLAPWNENKAKRVGSVVYKLSVKKLGMYFLSVRTFWTPEQGNSIRVTVNKELVCRNPTAKVPAKSRPPASAPTA